MSPAGKLPHFLLRCLRVSSALRSLEHTGLPQRATGVTCPFLGKTENSACQSLALWAHGCLDQQRPGPAKSPPPLPSCPSHLPSHTQLTLSFRSPHPSPSSPPHPGGCRASAKEATSFFQKSVVWIQERVEALWREGLRLSLKQESLPLAFREARQTPPRFGHSAQVLPVAGPGQRAARLSTPSSWTKAEAPSQGPQAWGLSRFPQRREGGCRRASCSCGSHTAACRCKGPGGRERGIH